MHGRDKKCVPNIIQETSNGEDAIGASGWFYYTEICYDARSHERYKK